MTSRFAIRKLPPAGSVAPAVDSSAMPGVPSAGRHAWVGWAWVAFVTAVAARVAWELAG